MITGTALIRPHLLQDESELATVARRLAVLARAPDVIGLCGELGVGKTSFARAFIRARAGSAIAVPSPSFTLVQSYALPDHEIWHCDLYRLTDPREAVELGLADAFATAITLIEWPERLAGQMPADRLEITLRYGPCPDARHILLTPGPSWVARLTGWSW